jgi:hypothetical protein
VAPLTKKRLQRERTVMLNRARTAGDALAAQLSSASPDPESVKCFALDVIDEIGGVELLTYLIKDAGR